MNKIIFPSLLIFIGVVVFLPTFFLSPIGDNWMVWWGGLIAYGTKAWPWTAWITYFNPYGFSYLILHLLYRAFGPSGSALYLTAFMFRLIMTFVFYRLLLDFRLSKFAAAVGTLALLVTPIGLEVQDWGFQMTSYLSLSLSFLAIILIRRVATFRQVVLIVICAFFALGSNPIRSHGTILLLLLFVILEWFIRPEHRRVLFFSAVGIIGSFALLLFKQSLGDPANTWSMLKPGVDTIFSSPINTVLNLFKSIADGFLPDQIFRGYLLIGWTKFLFGRTFPSLELFTGSGLVITFLSLAASIRLPRRWIFGLPLLLTFIVYVFLHGQPLLDQLQISVAGLYVLFFVTQAGYKLFHRLPGYDLDLLCLGLSVLFLLLPWIHDPGGVLSSYHRYQIFSAAALPVILSLIINHRPHSRILAVGALLSITFMILSTSFLVSLMSYRHNAVYSDQVWSQLDKFLAPVDYSHRRIVIYWQSDTPDRLQDSVTFGFGFRLGLRYGVWRQDDLPIAVNNLADLQSMISDGLASEKYIGQKYVYPPQDVFAFNLHGNHVTRLNISSLLANEH